MSLIKLGLNRLSVADKIQFGRQIAQAMTAHPNFPLPTPSWSALTDKPNTLETTHTEARAARVAGQSQDDGAGRRGGGPGLNAHATGRLCGDGERRG